MQIGEESIFAGGSRDLTPDDMKTYDILIPLDNISSWIWKGGFTGQVLAYPMEDCGEIIGPWKEFLTKVIELIKINKVLVYCHGGHGRTGTFLASLIAIAENPADPIAIVRKRYCKKAVEAEAQAKAIFKLIGKKLPKKYKKEFKPAYSRFFIGETFGYRGRGETFEYGSKFNEDKEEEEESVPFKRYWEI